MGLNAVSLVVFQDLTDDEEFRNEIINKIDEKLN